MSAKRYSKIRDFANGPHKFIFRKSNRLYTFAIFVSLQQTNFMNSDVYHKILAITVYAADNMLEMIRYTVLRHRTGSIF